MEGKKTDAIDNAKSMEAKARILQKTLNESASAAVVESKKSEQLKQSLAEAKTNNPMHAVANMFKDPNMREMMKAQQKAAIGPILDRQYADLFKQLNLTPEQAAQAKDLIGKKMLAGTDVAMSLIDDSLDASQRADLMKQVKHNPTTSTSGSNKSSATTIIRNISRMKNQFPIGRPLINSTANCRARPRRSAPRSSNNWFKR